MQITIQSLNSNLKQSLNSNVKQLVGLLGGEKQPPTPSPTRHSPKGAHTKEKEDQEQAGTRATYKSKLLPLKPEPTNANAW